VIGERFGRLVVVGIECAGKWRVQCDCGAVKVVAKQNVIVGKTQSCGCFRRETTIARSTKHGGAKRNNHSLTYKSWLSMIARVDYAEPWKAKYYQDRGIAICDRWYEFANFHEDMGDRPVGTSLDRIDNSRGYEPGNCRWATKIEQARNKRSNLKIEFRGRTMCLTEAAELAGLPYSRVQARLARGWTVEAALA
jgi:hypothetical protein